MFKVHESQPKFIVDTTRRHSLTSYLQDQGWLNPGEAVKQLSIPGEGNMNYVLRIVSDKRSFIIKQSRGYVEKYPHVAAPENRVLTEAAFYRKTSADPVIKAYMPKMIGIDTVNNIMALEDLGHTRDYTHLYRLDRKLDIIEILSLTTYLSRLHHAFYKTHNHNEFQNHEMRALNHQHIFVYPFVEDNRLDLDAIQVGLRELAMPYQRDPELQNEVSKVGKIYLSQGHYLLHGDYYPGSWVETKNGLKIIDPEFCFYGPLEFDLAVMMAHMLISRHEDSLFNCVWENYISPEPINKTLLNQFIGIEVIRRLIGLAQLPLALDLPAKKKLLKYARELILTN